MLVDRAQRAVAGQGCVVLVAGEAGIGKTVLLRAFVERVRAKAQPLWGMCDSLSTPRPLGPLRDVARRAGRLGARPAARHRRPARDLRGGAGRPALPPARVRGGGPALGRRGDAGPGAVPGPPDRGAAAAAGAVLPRRAGRRPSAEPGPRRPRLLPRRAPAAADPAEPVGRRRAARRARARPGRRAPPDRGQPVLRQPDPRPAGVPAAGERPGRRARPHRRAGPVGPALPGAALLHARTGQPASCWTPSACRRRRSGCWPPPAWSTGTGAASRSATRSPGPRSSRRPRPAASRRCTRR